MEHQRPKGRPHHRRKADKGGIGPLIFRQHHHRHRRGPRVPGVGVREIYGVYRHVASTSTDMTPHHRASISTVVRVAFTGVTLLVLASCSKDAPTAPTAPPIAACQQNNTALLAFGNRSAGSTYTVLFNGAVAATLAPGQETGNQSVAAGVQHRIEFTYANSGNRLACNPLTPVLAQCSQTTYTCAF